MDFSSGYEAVSQAFLQHRGLRRSTGIGVPEVRHWATTLPRGSRVLDLGAGPGFPITSVLVDEGLEVFAIEPAPSFVAAFQRNLPGVPIRCEAVQHSTFFGLTFDAVVAWGLIFLLEPDDQRGLIRRISEVLTDGGRLLFTAPAKPLVWNDIMTGLQSVSLGGTEYKRLLEEGGIVIQNEGEDAGGNHFYDAVKRSLQARSVLLPT